MRSKRAHQPATAIAVMMLGLLLVLLVGCVTRSGTTPNRAAPAASTQPGQMSETDAPIPVERTAWRFAGADGQIITTPHYQLYITLGDPKVIDRLLVFAERGLTHYTSALADLPMPAGHLETYLFQNRKQWEAKTRQLLPTQAPTFLNLGRGGFTTRGRSVLYYIDRHGRTRDTFAILAHEGWHQYAQTTFRRQLPIWLEEGIATYMEGYLTDPEGRVEFRPWANRERYRTLRHAVRTDKLIGLDEVITRTPQSFLEVSKDQLLVYYSQVWALVHFLHEGPGGQYRPKLIQLLTDAAHDRVVAKRSTRNESTEGRRRTGTLRSELASILVKQYFDAEFDTFEQQYTDFVHQVVAPGGYDRIAEGRSPLVESASQNKH